MAPSRSFKTVSRSFVVPGAAVTLAVSGIACLASFETEPHPRSRPPAPAFVVAAPGPRVPQALAVEAPRSAPNLIAAPPRSRGPDARVMATRVEASASGASSQVEKSSADRVISAMERADDLLARLRILDAALNSFEPDDSVALLERLLDHVPGNAEEVKSMRIALLSRLGLFAASGRAMNRLLASTEPGVVRNERLIAIETLHRDGSVAPLARPYLERIARGDHDLVVQDKARWALGFAGND